jgi:peptidyl-prolyl cis-trans isomerase B (cyclophilin B)
MNTFSVNAGMRMTYGAAALAGLAMLLVGCANAEDTAATNVTAEAKIVKKPATVILETSKGSIEITLWQDKAPATVSNFLAYVDDGYYSDLIFHRVINGFMIQGGGFDTSMKQKKTGAPIKNEARRDAPNARGTIAMARTPNIHSATSQFFINLKNNASLNHRDTTVRGFGYCAFGKVTDGMDVVDAIAKVATGRHGGHADVPTEPVVIKAIRRKE